MCIAIVPNRSSPPAILLREGYRAGGKVRNRTLLATTRWWHTPTLAADLGVRAGQRGRAVRL
jgi:hypothetical protein